MATNGVENAALGLLPTLAGAFSFVFMDERSVYATRDPLGIRPLSIGRLPNGFCFASETCALDIVGATLVRDSPVRVAKRMKIVVINQPDRLEDRRELIKPGDSSVHTTRQATR